MIFLAFLFWKKKFDLPANPKRSILMKPLTILPVVAMILFSCSKQETAPNGDKSFTLYKIGQGEHSSLPHPYRSIETGEIKFTVIFDNSAIYQTVDPENQEDINKLFGFSDNDQHHQQFSARFGWRWSEGALHLFAYVYNNGELQTRELGSFSLNEEISCSIKINADTYTFTAAETVVQMPRGSITSIAKGYQLYPYFGGDEPAPHEVRIWIRN